LKYSCDSCGRLATTRSLLCKPKAIPKPKTTKKKRKAAGKARTKKAARKTTKKKAVKKKR
jgi:hypothetical protein